MGSIQAHAFTKPRHPQARRRHGPTSVSLAPWPAERADTFVRMWKAGATVEAIGQAVDLTPSSVRAYTTTLRRWGHDLPPRRGGTGPAWAVERVAPVIEAVTRGVDNEGLAAIMGVSVRSISSTLARLRAAGHAIPCRPPGERPRGEQRPNGSASDVLSPTPSILCGARFTRITC